MTWRVLCSRVTCSRATCSRETCSQVTCSRETCWRETCWRETCSRETCSRVTCSRATCSPPTYPSRDNPRTRVPLQRIVSPVQRRDDDLPAAPRQVAQRSRDLRAHAAGRELSLGHVALGLGDTQRVEAALRG